MVVWASGLPSEVTGVGTYGTSLGILTVVSEDTVTGVVDGTMSDGMLTGVSEDSECSESGDAGVSEYGVLTLRRSVVLEQKARVVRRTPTGRFTSTSIRLVL